ncbi:Mll3243 protein [hydrothermal vent metagenome]|uniref:Mll3243 protein n=1 Tax=hydrothermal vent metagenome TaxID=652676 RepID=A0A1W1BAJ7_9ZZZZ
MMRKQKKVILMGNFSVGKTSLIRRFVDNSFSDKYISTIGVKISKKIIEFNNKSITLLIWDIEGALDKIKRVNKTYIKGANSAIIVSDVLSENIIEDLKMNLDDLYSVNGFLPTIIAINKIDKNPDFQIDLDEIKSLYPSVVDSFFTSAKSGVNVENIFQKLIEEMEK